MGDEVVKHCENCKKDIAASNFVIHSAVCERTIQLCGRCDEPFKQDCLEQHNEDFHATINCSYCDSHIEKWTSKKHMTACFRRPVSCSFCDITKPFNELSEHMEFCGARTDKCSTCKQFILLRDLGKHKETCQRQQKSFESYNIKKYEDVVKSHSTITDTRIGSEVGATSKKEKNVERNNFLRYKGANKETAYPAMSEKRIGEVGGISKPLYRKSTLCQYCNTEKPLDEFSEHIEVCGARTEKCSICKQFVLLREFEKHKVMCLKQQRHFERSDLGRYKDIVHEDLPNSDRRNRDGVRAMSENTSSYMGMCYICKRNIPWVDMNTHIPSCATINNKCSRCGEEVDSDQLKDHMLRLCPAVNQNKRGYSTRISSENDSSSRSVGSLESSKGQNTAREKTCPYCKSNFPKMSIVDHMVECCEQYKCSHCLETVLRKNQNVHEKFCPNMIGNRSKKSKVLQGTQSVEMSSNKTSNSRIRNENNTSSYMGVCHICKRNIPWVDMNTHVPSCATFNNKCSRCGEEVGAEMLKDHMLRLCPALNYTKPSAQSVEMPSKKNSRISIEDISQEAMEEQCPYCSKTIPKLRYENHLGYCSQRLKKCHFCETFISVVDEKSHLSNCIGLNPNKDESYAATNLTSYNEAVGGYKAKERGRIHVDNLEQQTESSCCSASPCKKDTKRCMFCGDKIPKCEERNHLKICAFKKRDKSYKISPENDEWEKRDGKNSGAVSKYSRMLNKVESSFKKCIHCGMYFDVVSDPGHVDTCIQNLGQCTLCNTVVFLSSFKKHLETDCLKYKDDEKWSKVGSKKKGKNKSNKNSTPPKEKNIWNFVKKFTTDIRMSLGYDETMENPQVNEADYMASLVYEKTASEIKLPCEFCEKLFPMESLVEHQSGCRPDLVHFPPNHDGQDVTKASELLATNLLDENSFSTDKEFTLPQMKRKLNRNHLSRFDTDAAPGSFLEEYITYEEKKDECPRKEECEFAYVANSKRQSNENKVEMLPTINTSISSNDLEMPKPEFSSSLSSRNATSNNFRIENIIEKESRFSPDNCKSNENKNVKIETFSNRSERTYSISSEESIDEDVKSRKFSNQNEIIDVSSSDESDDEKIISKRSSNQKEITNLSNSDVSEDEEIISKKNSNQKERKNSSSSDESIDEENIDAYITYLSNKHEIEDVGNDEINSHIYHLEENLSAPHKSESICSISKRKNSCEAKNIAGLGLGNSEMNAEENYGDMLLSDDDELEVGHDKYSVPMQTQVHKRDSVKQFLTEINCELRQKKNSEFNTEAFHKWRSAKHSAMVSKSRSSSLSSSDTD